MEQLSCEGRHLQVPFRATSQTAATEGPNRFGGDMVMVFVTRATLCIFITTIRHNGAKVSYVSQWYSGC